MAEIPYITFEKELLRIKTVVNKTTEKKLELSGNLKILYRYMYDRYLFFRSRENEFFDNQDAIAEALAMTPRTIISLIKNLVDVGLVEKKSSRRFGVNNSNSYVVYDVFNKAKFDTAALIKFCVPKVFKKSTYVKPKRQLYVIEEDDPFECPF